MQGIPVPAWPTAVNKGTPDEIPNTASQPMPENVEPMQPVIAEHVIVALKHEAAIEDQHQEHEAAPLIRRRQSERIKQILFNKPPSPGLGLISDDAMVLE